MNTAQILLAQAKSYAVLSNQTNSVYYKKKCLENLEQAKLKLKMFREETVTINFVVTDKLDNSYLGTPI